MCEHRLAGPGLAGEHVQAGPQTQLGALDQQQILDSQLQQHDRRSSSARRRIARLERDETQAGASAATGLQRQGARGTVGDASA
jgi:hypothetical protein